MLRARYERHVLQFRFDARTSRGSMIEKETFFITIEDTDMPGRRGVGECGVFRGLSADDRPDYEECLRYVCRNIGAVLAEGLPPMSSIRMGVESALQMLYTPIDNEWTRGEAPIIINGLIWMGDMSTMLRRVEEKLDEGFRCLKLKIGGIDFESEIEILRSIRDRYAPSQLELRLDANGHFKPEEALSRIEQLAQFDIHSIEQPIAPRHHSAMAEICRYSPIPVALDEEIIGCTPQSDMQRLLDRIMPQYIILKPTLCGGLEDARQWQRFAAQRSIGSWVTSALESNIGLEAIAANTWQPGLTMAQGLGTGELFHNNIPSRLERRGQELWLKS